MSKADGWDKVSPYEWRKSGQTFRAEIVKVTGNGPHPYALDVYPLPRKDHIGADGRYRPIREGHVGKLAEAKAICEAAIKEHTREDT